MQLQSYVIGKWRDGEVPFQPLRDATTAELAPFHGRVLLVDRSTARYSTGHGSPLPGLVHGGPGRAGGGEELGGLRAVLHHMQRTAVQAGPQTLALWPRI
jgi:oxepin-CoA hydrolase / 3-oxo-5,6-dehydrosuberyl-CoA semialdehyde dehydrogenase